MDILEEIVRRTMESTGASPGTGTVAAVVALMRAREEEAYVRGMEMERKLLRLRLGLATKEDQC